jgi:hypothetical protein
MYKNRIMKTNSSLKTKDQYKEKYFFPDLGVTVQASNMKEAEELAIKKSKK